MRNSRDEEMIAYIIMYIIVGKNLDPSAKNLDNIYKFKIQETHSEHLSYTIETQIDKIGADIIKKRFLIVFEEIELIVNKAERKLSDIIHSGKPFGKFRSFQIIFLSLYNMLIIDKKIVNNYKGLIEQLNGIGDRILNNVDSKDWNAKFREEKIKAVQGVLSEYFEKNNKTDDPAIDNWVVRFENLLVQSKIEQQQFDFKIGFYNLSFNSSFMKATFSKVIRTLTSMANLGPNKKGYVIIGIADKETDKVTFERLYSTVSKPYMNFSITGLDKEAEKDSNSIDTYFNKLRNLVKNEPIEDYTKDYIARNMRLINYFDKSVLVFEIESASKPLLYDDKFFVREGSNVEEIKPKNYSDLFERFAVSKA